MGADHSQPVITPFGHGSVSVGLHPDPSLAAAEQVDRLLRDAEAVNDAGFDGVTVSEHHVGFPGYLPQPLLAVTWLLERCPRLWGAPAPVLLGLRNPALLVEELAWSAARFPGRIGAALAPGYAVADFAAVGIDHDSRLERFRASVSRFVDELTARGPLAADPAVGAQGVDIGSVLLACNSAAAARRAAGLGLGMLFPGGEAPERLAGLIDEYRRHDGSRAAIGIVVVWLGDSAAASRGTSHATTAAYVSAAAPNMRQAGGFALEPFVGAGHDVANRLAGFVTASRVTGLNLRFRIDGAPAHETAEQIARFGAELLPSIRRSLLDVVTSI